MKGGRIIIGCALLLLAGCGPQVPQIPSQRKNQAPQPDSAHLALLELNRQLAQAADEQLAAIVRLQEEPYALYEGNVWAAVLDPGDTDSPSPRNGEEWTVHMRVFNLEGQMLMDSEQTCRIGKQELPQAVDANIGEWHKGCRVRMFAPWYTAFGLSGTDNIPPYENVLIDIELK